MTSLTDDEHSHYRHGRLRLTRDELPEYGPSLRELQLDVWEETPHRLRVKVLDPLARRWEVPEDLLPLPGKASRVA